MDVIFDTLMNMWEVQCSHVMCKVYLLLQLRHKKLKIQFDACILHFLDVLTKKYINKIFQAICMFIYQVQYNKVKTKESS